jgi:hypothetical protein
LVGNYEADQVTGPGRGQRQGPGAGRDVLGCEEVLDEIDLRARVELAKFGDGT